MIGYKETEYGFIYGPVTIERHCSDDKKGWVMFGIQTARVSLDLYVTKTGKVRIHSRNRREWKEAE